MLMPMPMPRPMPMLFTAFAFALFASAANIPAGAQPASASASASGPGAAALHQMVVEPIDWAAAPLIVASTASTVEVDVMPFLSRTRPACEKAGTCTAGPFDAYYEALQNLGAEYVRYSPWYPYPLVVVTELSPPDCTPARPATNWNSTNFDAIMADFMSAVCGPDAASGKCKHSVVQQLSTMPSWLYVNGTDPKTGISQDPWEYKVVHPTDSYFGFTDYNKGTKLKDESCKPMAAYMARVVGHYTSGGHHDTCGHWHPSGLHYNWTGLSVLNEDEHDTGAERVSNIAPLLRLGATTARSCTRLTRR